MTSSYRIALNRRRVSSRSVTTSLVLPTLSQPVAKNPEFEAWSKAWRISWSIGLICILHGCIFAFCGGWHPDISREFYLTESNNLRGAVSLRHVVSASPAALLSSSFSSSNSSSSSSVPSSVLSAAGGAVTVASTQATQSPYWNSPFDCTNTHTHSSHTRVSYYYQSHRPSVLPVASVVTTVHPSRRRYLIRSVSSSSSSSSSITSGVSDESDAADQL